jgi:mono/diheme cytochrome c family protein
MSSRVRRASWYGRSALAAGSIAAVVAAVVVNARLAEGRRAAGTEAEAVAAQGGARAQIMRGRTLVLHQGCGDCHGGFANPAADGFLAGMRSPLQEFVIGPFKTRPRNITPDNATGIGRFSERQIFNALRYGLRPGETPDVDITSSTPGKGNFPENPKYLAPPMPWTAFRHMSDQELRDIAAYLKRGVKPVANRVVDSEGPPDFWASEYTVEKMGPYPARPYPTANEKAP